MQLRDHVGAFISSVLGNGLVVAGIAAAILPPNSQIVVFSRTDWIRIYGVMGGIAGGVLYLLAAFLLILRRKQQKNTEPGNVAGLAFTAALVAVVVSALLINHAEVYAKLR